MSETLCSCLLGVYGFSSVIGSTQMGHTIPQALSQLDLAVPWEPQHNHSLSFLIPTVQEVLSRLICTCVICHNPKE